MTTTAETTGTDICTQALKKAGILGAGVDAEADDIIDALTDLNDMIAQWNRKRWLVYRLEDLSVVSTGALFYTMGPSGDLDISVRPDRIESAFVRQINNTGTNPVDTPLRLIQSREEYSRIALKSLSSFARSVWYDPELPLGKVYPWPLPQSAIYELHIQVKTVLEEIPQDDIANVVVLPGEYFAALKFNLARRLRVAYRLPADAELNALAEDALLVIRGSNAAIAELTTPAELSRGGLYDIYSDRIY